MGIRDWGLGIRNQVTVIHQVTVIFKMTVTLRAEIKKQLGGLKYGN